MGLLGSTCTALPMAWFLVAVTTENSPGGTRVSRMARMVVLFPVPAMVEGRKTEHVSGAQGEAPSCM